MWISIGITQFPVHWYPLNMCQNNCSVPLVNIKLNSITENGQPCAKLTLTLNAHVQLAPPTHHTNTHRIKTPLGDFGSPAPKSLCVCVWKRETDRHREGACLPSIRARSPWTRCLEERIGRERQTEREREKKREREAEREKERERRDREREKERERRERERERRYVSSWMCVRVLCREVRRRVVSVFFRSRHNKLTNNLGFLMGPKHRCEADLLHVVWHGHVKLVMQKWKALLSNSGGRVH